MLLPVRVKDVQKQIKDPPPQKKPKKKKEELTLMFILGQKLLSSEITIQTLETTSLLTFPSGAVKC